MARVRLYTCEPLFLGCEQADKIDVKRVMERVKKEIRKRLDHLMGLNLNDKNLMKAINCRVIPIAGYVMNVCNLGKGDLGKLDMTVKFIMERRIYYGEKDFMEDNQGMRDYIQRETKVAEDYDEAITKVACYMASATNKWIRLAWRNEIHKEQIPLKNKEEKAMRKVGVTVPFDEGSVIFGEESYNEWKEGWKN